MRIHSNNLTSADLHAAARKAGVQLEDYSGHGSRSRAGAFDVTLSGDGRTGGRWGNSGKHGAAEHKAASWDQWGMFLEALWQADASVTVPRVYDDHETFRWITAARYDALTPATAHHRHRWNYGGENVTGVYSVQSCACGAALRRVYGSGVTARDMAHS